MDHTDRLLRANKTMEELNEQAPTKGIYSQILCAKQEFGEFTKDTEGYGYQYVTLDKIQKRLNPILEKFGLLVTHELGHSVVMGDPQYGVTTRIVLVGDRSGPMLSSFFPIDPTTKPQDIGSARTYGMRYNITALLDLVLVGEDDDGAKAQGTKTSSKKRTSTAKSATKQTSQNQVW